MDIVQLDALIAETGPLDDEITAIVRDGDSRWIVQVADVVLAIEQDAGMGTIRLWAEIGAPLESSRTEINEALLVYNGAAAETGGVVMSLTAPGGSIVQSVIIPTAGLTPQSLVVMLVNFASKAEVWRSLVVVYRAGSSTPMPASDMPFIRL